MNQSENPFYTGIAKKPNIKAPDVSDQVKKYKEEEATHKADPILPHQFEHLKELLGDTFVQLAQLQQMLQQAKQAENIDEADVTTLQNKIDRINNLILELPCDIDKLAL